MVAPCATDLTTVPGWFWARAQVIPLGSNFLGFARQRSWAGCAAHVVLRQTTKEAGFSPGSMTSRVLTDGQAIKGLDLLSDGQQRIYLQ